MSRAIEDVIAERVRQIEAEGWTADHDDQHDAGDLCCAGAAYALNAGSMLSPYSQQPLEEIPIFWPIGWDKSWWKPRGPRRDLVRAAALIIAEIDRIDRAGSVDWPQPDPSQRYMPSPMDHFINLVATMDADSGGCSSITTKQLETGAMAVQRMIAAGQHFPMTKQDAFDALYNLDSIYWELAADEESEVKEQFGNVPGFIMLHEVLNAIFNGEGTE